MVPRHGQTFASNLAGSLIVRMTAMARIAVPGNASASLLAAPSLEAREQHPRRDPPWAKGGPRVPPPAS